MSNTDSLFVVPDQTDEVLSLDSNDSLFVVDEPEIVFAPDGTRLTPITEQDVPLSELSEEVVQETNRIALEKDFAEGVKPNLDKPFAKGFVPLPVEPNVETGFLDTKPFVNTQEVARLENNRQENVLVNKYGGQGYQGKDAVGLMPLSTREGLGRRSKFEDRVGYFKKNHPEGRYIRADVGGGKLVELYSLSPNGKIFRVDPTFNPEAEGAGRELLADLLDVESSVITPTTGAAVAASIIFPPSAFGVAGVGFTTAGANLLEQWAVSETGKSWYEVMSDPKNLADATLMGALESTIFKVSPIAATRFKTIFLEGGDTSNTILTNRLITEGSREGKEELLPSVVQAQEAAKKLDLPLLTISQVLKTPVLQRITQQSASLSGTLPNIWNRQKQAVYDLLQKKAQSPDGLESFSAAELRQYLTLQAGKLQDDLTNMYSDKVVSLAAPESLAKGNSLQIAKEIRTLTSELGTSMNTVIDDLYARALSTSGAEGAVFDLTPVASVAQKIRIGTQTGAGTAPASREVVESSLVDARGMPITTEKVIPERALTETIETQDARLMRIVDKFENVWNKEVKEIRVIDKDDQFTFNALQQMKAMKDEVGQIAFEGGSVVNQNAVDLYKAISQALDEPVGGGTEWKALWKEATELSKMRSDLMNHSKLHSFFAKNTEVNPSVLAQKFYSGEFNYTDWDVMSRWLTQSSRTPQGRRAGEQFINSIRLGFLNDLKRQPELLASRWTKLKQEQPELTLKLVPDVATRKGLDEAAEKSTFLGSDVVNTALQRDRTNAENLRTIIRQGTSEELKKLIDESGGFLGNRANNIRASVFGDILEKSRELGEGGEQIINPAKLSQELTSLLKFEGPYANLEPVFKSANHPDYLKDIQDLRVYTSFQSGAEDVGTSLQAASVTAKLQDFELGAFKQLFQAGFLSRFLAQPVSVRQIKEAQRKGEPFTFRKGGVYSVILDRMRQGFVDNSESLEEEIKRTQESPQIGEFSSVAPEVLSEPTPPLPTPPAPTPAVPSPVSTALNIQAPSPARSPAGSSGADFASLFPRDELGGAIAQRRGQGIMSLA